MENNVLSRANQGEQMTGNLKVLLIGGASHVGKSTFAKRLADEKGWSYLSTDFLARHPGRPWRHDDSSLPDDVVAYYSKLTAEEQVNSVVKHYRQNVWPIVDAVIRSRLNNSYDPCLVFEGSAILPDKVRAAQYDNVNAVWLTASDEVIRSRIARESQLKSSSLSGKRLIDSFIDRSIIINQILMDSVSANSQKSLDTGKLALSVELESLFNAE